MVNILVANPKGGSGKTTLSTNLAGYLAKQGNTVILHDLDRQQSASRWLERRSSELPLIHAWGLKDKPPVIEADYIVTDSAAGLREEKLSDAVKKADCVLVPIQPSAFDLGATDRFLEVLLQEKAIRKNKTFVGLIGMRHNSRTLSSANLTSFMENAEFEVLTYLRNAQVYVTAAEQGSSVFDMRKAQVEKDLAQWAPLLKWLKHIDGTVSK